MNSFATGSGEWLNHHQSDSPIRRGNFAREVIAMLAEKFFLILETIRSRAAEDIPRPVVSTAPHVPIKVESPRKK
jgi:hypothetical protein